MPEQADIAEDMGVVAPPLSEIEFLSEFAGDLPQSEGYWVAF